MKHDPDTQRMIDQSRALIASAKAAQRPLSANERRYIRGTISAARQSNADKAELDRQIAHLGSRMASDPAGIEAGGAAGYDLYSAIHAAGYDRRSHPVVEVPFDPGMFATATFDGDIEDMVRIDRPTAPLGADQRFLWPALPFQGVGSDVTNITSFRQKSRTLPSLASMIRDIDAATEKPEVATVTELVTEPLHQIPAMESNIPNVMLESASFRGWISDDLGFGYASAVDFHVIEQIVAVSPPVGPSGADLLEQIVRAAGDVVSAGYSPSILAAAPEVLIDLALLKQPGTEDYLFSGREFDIGLRKVAVAGLDVPLVIDPAAAGVFYNSPVRFATFEENAGKTNSSNVRVESHGVFVVQRVEAIVEVATGAS